MIGASVLRIKIGASAVWSENIGPIPPNRWNCVTSCTTILREHVPEDHRILLYQGGFTDERALLLGILQDIGKYLHVGFLGLQRKMRDLTLLPILDTTYVEMCDVTAEGEELIDEFPHILLGLETTATAGVHMGNVQYGTNPVHLVHDLAYLVEGSELTEFSHGLHTEDDVLDPLVIQHVLALGQPGNDRWECRLGRFTI